MAAHSLTWQQPVMLCKQSHQDRNSGLFTQGSKGKGAIKPKGKGCLLFNILLGYENSRLFLVCIYLLSLTQSPQRSREKQILSKHRSLKDTYDGGILRATANIICFKLLCQFAKGFTLTDSKSAKFRSHPQKFNYTVRP